MNESILKNIQSEELKKYATEELINGLKPIGYEVSELKEEITFQGVGAIDYLMWFDKEKEEVFESHIVRSTGEKINFSDINEKDRGTLSYFLRRGYRFVSIDDVKQPTEVLLYNFESYREFVELTYDEFLQELKSTYYPLDKIKRFHSLMKNETKGSIINGNI